MKIIDITLPLSTETPVWPGDQGVSIRQTDFLGNGSDFNVSRTEFGVHAGTHIDAPFHLFNQGNTVDNIPLDKLIGPVQVLKIDDSIGVITDDVLCESGFKKNTERLLLKTKNSENWIKNPNQFNKNFSAIDSSAAKFLIDEGVSLIGIDYFSISPYNNLVAPHQILLKAGIVILENACLVDVQPGFYTLFCLPLSLVGTDGAPVRAVLTSD